MRPEVHVQVEEESAEEWEKCRARRARVLAHPDLAALLMRPPFSATNPLFWSGYIPPKYWMNKPNNSPIRKQLIRICEMVAEREANPAPTAPTELTPKTLQILHIHLGEYGITDRDEKLQYLSTAAGRTLESSKDLSEEEALYATSILRNLIRLEKEEENAAQSVPEDQGMVSEVVGERVSGGADGGWPAETGEPPY